MRILILILFFLIVIVQAPAYAASIVYDNTTSGRGSAFADGLFEFGDGITLAGTERLVTEFTFGYEGRFTTGENDETARIRFYALDAVGGHGGLPETQLYDSGSFSIVSGINTYSLNLTGLGVVVPDSFAWTVQWGGTSQTLGDIAGLQLYDPPTVGSSNTYFYSYRRPALGFEEFGFSDSICHNGCVPNNANFYAQVKAVNVPVPEPSTLLLLGSGLVGLGFVRRRFKG